MPKNLHNLTRILEDLKVIESSANWLAKELIAAKASKDETRFSRAAELQRRATLDLERLNKLSAELNSII